LPPIITQNYHASRTIERPAWGNWGMSGTAQTLSGMDLIVCSIRLTFRLPAVWALKQQRKNL